MDSDYRRGLRLRGKVRHLSNNIEDAILICYNERRICINHTTY